MQEEILLLGEKVELKPLTIQHIASLFEAGRDEEIWSFSSKKITTIKDIEDLVNEALAAKEKGIEYPFVIIEKNSGKLVGSTRYLNISLPHRNLEIGWTWLNPAVWRTAVNTECKYLLLKYAFESLQMLRVQLKADLRNTRSNRAILRIGATKEGVLRKDRILQDGHVRDAAIYSIVDSEWPTVKLKLEQYLAK